MRRRALAPLMLAALLVLAGCTGAGGETTTTVPESTTQTTAEPATPAPTTQPPQTTTPSVPATAFPPGTGPDGVTNVSALAAAHHEARFQSDFVATETSVQTQLVRNATRQRTEQSVAYVDLDASRANISLRTTTNTSGEVTDTETVAFLNRSLLVTQTTAAGRTTNRTSSIMSFESALSAGQQVEGVLTGVAFEPVATVDDGNRTLVEFDVTGINTTGIPENRSVDNVDGSLVVDDRGLIRSVSLQYRVTTSDGTPLLLRAYSRSVTPADLDVERPEWVETALSQQTDA